MHRQADGCPTRGCQASAAAAGDGSRKPPEATPSREMDNVGIGGSASWDDG